jgi:hypothetical protein
MLYNVHTGMEVYPIYWAIWETFMIALMFMAVNTLGVTTFYFSLC